MTAETSWAGSGSNTSSSCRRNRDLDGHGQPHVTSLCGCEPTFTGRPSARAERETFSFCPNLTTLRQTSLLSYSSASSHTFCQPHLSPRNIKWAGFTDAELLSDGRMMLTKHDYDIRRRVYFDWWKRNCWQWDFSSAQGRKEYMNRNGLVWVWNSDTLFTTSQRGRSVGVESVQVALDGKDAENCSTSGFVVMRQ